MSWRDRLSDYLLLVSPSGLNFWPRWVGDKRSMKKKLGIFEFPGQRGAVVQDLDVGPKEYPLTFYFDGPDNDINADRFFAACNERGPWTVTHPTKGTLVLQLVSVTEEIQPVTSGNVTQFSTDWIEVGLNLSFVSLGQLSAEVTDQIETVKDSLSLMQKFVTGVSDFITKILSVSTALYANYNAVMGVYQNIRSLVASAVGSVASLVGVIATIVSAPADVLRDTKSRFGYYKSTIRTSFIELNAAIGRLHNSPDKPTKAADMTKASSIVSVSCLNGMAKEIVNSNFNSREEALGYLNSFNDMLSEVLGGLDSVQTLFADASLTQRYISLGESFNDLMRLRQLVNNLVFRQMFDLSSTKYITLQSNRAPVEIAITEGVDLDTFISVNRLHGSDILLLPAGRVVEVSA